MKNNFTGILVKLIIISVSFCYIGLAQSNNYTLKLNAYDEFVEALMKEWKIPGAAIAIVKDGNIVYSKGFGYRDLKNKIKVTTKTLFGVGSITKSFLAGSIGILQDEQRVNIDTPIVKYISDFKLYDDCMTKQMTLRDMMSHRSGLSGSAWLFHSKDRKDMTYGLHFEKPTKGFRESYQYNGYNITVSADILEQITGKKWEDYVKAKMFIPMEMIQSCFTYKNAEQIEDHSLAYMEKDGVIRETIFAGIENPIGAPAGLMFSNVEEMSNWLITFLNKGTFKGKQIISESYINEMIKPNISHSIRPGIEQLFAEYGLGLHISAFEGNTIVYHMGNYYGFTAQMLMHPESKTGIIILTNMDSPTGVNALAFRALEKILNLKETDLLGKCREVKKIYQANDSKAKADNLKNIQPDAHPTLPIERYTGSFTNERYGNLDIIAENNTLKALYHNLKSVLNPYRNDVFETADNLWNAKLSFLISSGKIYEIQVNYDPSAEQIHFNRIKK
jgi:CubicO group peptidase (beta-lactamase class C family)